MKKSKRQCHHPIILNNLRFIRYDNKKQSSSGTGIKRDVVQRKKESIVKAVPVVQKENREKPEPVPIRINKGETIVHKSFGTGKVVSSKGKYIKVQFDTVGEKSFANPGAFEGGFIRKN